MLVLSVDWFSGIGCSVDWVSGTGLNVECVSRPVSSVYQFKGLFLVSTGFQGL